MAGSRWIFSSVLGLVLLSGCTVGPCGVTWLFDKDAKSTPAADAEPLPVSAYAAAETAYRNFLPGGLWSPAEKDWVYCLEYGERAAALPADFMARFSQPAHQVITGTGWLEFKPGSTTDRQTGREAVVLTLRSLSIHGDHAEATVLYAAPSMVATETLELVARDGQWSVAQMKEQSRSYF